MAPPRRLNTYFVFLCVGVVVVLSYTVAPTTGFRRLQAEPFQRVSYSPPSLQNDYNSSSKFNPQGMGNLYNITKWFINLTQPNDPYPEGLLKLDDGQLELGTPEFHALLGQYSGVLAVVLVGLLVAAVLPVAGLLFCCCRCTGRCGARSQPFDKRHDPCRRHCLGVILAVINIAILFGVVCAFVTNEYMEDGVKRLPERVDVVVDDVRLYIQNTKKEINTLLNTNYFELSETLKNNLNSAGRLLENQLAEISNATSLNNLTNIVMGLGNIKADLSEVSKLTNTFQSSARIIRRGLSDLRSNLNKTLQECKKDPSCRIKLENKFDGKDITEIDLNIKFEELPNISDSLQNISSLMANRIQQHLLSGTKQLTEIQIKIQQQVGAVTPTVYNALKKLGYHIAEVATEMTGYLDHADDFILRGTKNSRDEMKSFLNKYSSYRYNAGLAMSCVLFLILTPITFGLFCGFCGKRPDAAYSDDSCSKGTGARFLMIAVWFIFLTSSVMIILVLVHFIVGVFGERAVCQSFRSPSDNKLFEVMDQLVSLDQLYQAQSFETDRSRARHRREQPHYTNLSTVIMNCHYNFTIYNVLSLDNQIHINQVLRYPDNYQFQDILKKIQQDLDIGNNIQLLNEDAKTQLKELAGSPLSKINFTNYSSIEPFNPPTFSDFINKLEEFADSVTTDEIKFALKSQARSLTHFQRDVQELTVFAKNLSDSVLKLKEHLNLNHSSLAEAVDFLVKEVEEAELYLRNHGHEELKMLAKNFSSVFVQQVQSYMERVVDLTQSEVGKCWPLSQAYNATLTATCDAILNPFNGFWASVGWCLVLFMITLIVAVRLSSLYQKSDPWPGSLVEAEYMYDAYADRDNIPLANVSDKKRKKTKPSRGRSYQETYDNSSRGSGGGYVGDYSAHLGRGERDRTERAERERAAPKHWDFPNNGPPRYHNPHVHTPQSPPLSTEYERPPPYYFPGPGENRS